MKTELPTRLIRIASGDPKRDMEKRTIGAQIMTRMLARDGGIVIPEGIVTKGFEANPVVQALHGLYGDSHSPVIGRSLGLRATTLGMDSITQFADTELGREYAYLYGLNPSGEVYMRAWSFGWRTLESDVWDVSRARTYLQGFKAWDEDLVTPAIRNMGVWVSVRSEMTEYSAVAVGADREALSRAMHAGVRAAGEHVARLDLDGAQGTIEKLRLISVETQGRLEKLEGDVLALRGDGAAAAMRGDTAGIVEELGSLIRLAKESTNRRA